MARSEQAPEPHRAGSQGSAERVRKLAAAGEEFLREASHCVDEAQQKLLEAGKEAPGRIRPLLQDLNGRLAEAKLEYERHAASFREKFLAAGAGEDEFRARLVMLESEYSSRLRIAEEGLRLLLENLDERFQGVEEQVKRRCAQAREFIEGWGRPVHEQLLELLRERDAAEALWRQRLEAREQEAEGGLKRRLEEAQEAVRRLEAALEQERRLGAQESKRREALDAQLKAEQDSRLREGFEREKLKQELETERRLRGQESAARQESQDAQKAADKKLRERESAQAALQSQLGQAAESAHRLQQALDSERRLREQAEQEVVKLRHELTRGHRSSPPGS